MSTLFGSVYFIFLSQPNIHKYKIIMTTYKKLLCGVTGSTQAADAPLVRATHVMKTNSTHIIVKISIVVVRYVKRSNSFTFYWWIVTRSDSIDAGDRVFMSLPVTTSAANFLERLVSTMGSGIVRIGPAVFRGQKS